MSSYRALARKYRPETFSQVVGQEHVTGTLRAAMRKDKLSHAYLFSGPRGCGKTTVARLLAKAINCPDAKDGDPCGTCEVCTGIAKGGYLDVLEIDAASNTGVDNVRDLRDMAQYAPGRGGCRVFIIDEVHMLSKGAFNALLKVLEEPPKNVYFFFATTEPNKIPRTILSRCQRFDFRLLSREELGARLAEIATAEDVALDDGGRRVLVSLAEGSMRDALSLLDQAIASCEGTIDEPALVALFGLVRSDLYLELNEAIVAGDPARALRLVDSLAEAGQDLDVFAQGLVADIRNLLVVRVAPELGRSVDLPPEQIAILERQAAAFSAADLLAMLERAATHFERIHRSTQPRLMLEAAVVELARWESRVELATLVAQLRGGAGAVAGGSAGGSGTGGGRRQAARPAPTSVPSSPAGRRHDAAGVAATTGAAGAATLPIWAAFLESLMRTHPRLASCLMEGLPSLDDAESRVTIGFAADNAFVLKNLATEVPLLEERLSSFLGRAVKIRLDAVAQPAPESAAVHEEVRRQIAPTDREALADQCRQDDTLGKLVDLLGGEPLPDSEREKWN